MKRVLLIFTDINESAFISANLRENGFETFVSADISNAGSLVKKIDPDLVVVNEAENENEMRELLRELNAMNVKSLFLSDHQNTLLHNELSYVIRPSRPKLLLSIIRGILNEEEMGWVPLTH